VRDELAGNSGNAEVCFYFVSWFAATAPIAADAPASPAGTGLIGTSFLIL
jgi:hypothetical protein